MFKQQKLLRRERERLFLNCLKFIGLTAILFSVTVIPVQAAGVELGKDGILEQAEPLFEIVNLVLALVIIGISLSGLKKAGGTVRKAWMMVIVAAIFFGVLELLGVLKGFQIFRFRGLGDLVEFFMAGALLLAVRKLSKLF